MWQPEAGWTPMPGGRGALTEGLWTVERDGRRWAVKRVRRPGADEIEFLDSTGSAYWRREAEVAADHDWLTGLRHPEVLAVEDDDEGYTLWTAHHEGVVPTALLTAAALARLAAVETSRPWSARGVLRERLRRIEDRGGWPTLERTTFADLAAELWRRRGAVLNRYDDLPQRAAHGDVVPGNLVGVTGGDVIAVDWSAQGSAPPGADLGYFALSCREDFEVLVDTYLREPAVAGIDAAAVRFAAEAMAVYTVVSRAEWALSRVVRGEGALAGKFRHPSVAPHLRALQRQFPQVESLLSL